MAKQRNSLGICVLPLTGNSTISWEQYKERTGIDLEKIFDIVLVETDYKVRFKMDFSKLIVLSNTVENDVFPRVATPNAYQYGDSSTPGDAYLSLSVIMGDYDSGYTLSIAGNKTVTGGEI